MNFKNKKLLFIIPVMILFVLFSLFFIKQENIGGNEDIAGASILNLRQGGTGISSYTAGDMVWASSSAQLFELTAIGANGNCWKVTGASALGWGGCGGVASNSLDFDEFVNSPTLDANLNIQRAGYYIGIGAVPSTVFEVQGTASASYLLTGNTLQVGGFASAAYSRFGTSTLTTNPAGNWITGSNDLLISGDLYGVGSIAFAGPASISNTLFVGTGGKTGFVGIGTTDPGAKLHISGGNILLDNSQFIYAKNAAGTAVQIFGIDSNGDITVGRGNLNTVDNNDGRVIMVAGTGKEYRWLNAAGTILALLQESTGFLSIGPTGAGKSKLHIEGASGWIIQDEQDTNPTTTELDANDSIAIYNKANKLVFAYNNAGTITYLSIPLDGSTTTWTHSTTAP